MRDFNNSPGRHIQKLEPWHQVLHATRAASVILLVTAIGLIIPTQTPDMLVNLSDSRSSNWWPILAFHFCLLVLCFNLWHWPRAVLSATLDIDDTRRARARWALINGGQHRRLYYRLLNDVPRVYFIAGAGIGIAAALESRQYIQAIAIALWTAALYVFLVNRVGSSAKWLNRNRDKIHPATSVTTSFWDNFDILFRRAPVGAAIAHLGLLIATTFLIVGAVGLLDPGALVWSAWPSILGGLFPGPSAALLCLGLAIAPLSWLIYMSDQCKQFEIAGFSFHPPVVIGLAAIITVTPIIDALHNVRVAQDDNPSIDPARRQTLSALFVNWTQSCVTSDSDTVRPIIVAVSGGASRAGMWAARTLTAVDQAVAEQGGSSNTGIFAVSSVSGGSLGTAAYVALRHGTHSRDCHLPVLSPGELERRDDALVKGLRADALGPLLAGALFGDTPRAIFGLPAAILSNGRSSQLRGGDRAEALEHAFEHNWDAILPQLQRASRTTPPAFYDSYLSLYYEKASRLHPCTDQHLLRKPDGTMCDPGGMPLWIANGADARNGGRLITAPFKLNAAGTKDPDKVGPFFAARDVLALLQKDIPISTAIDNTARFPWLSPAGELEPFGQGSGQAPSQIVDGGYFDNEGMVTALALARWLRANGRALTGRTVDPILIQATADADEGIKDADIIRCGRREEDDPGPASGQTRPSQFFVPLMGLNGARAGHSAIALREARHEFCRDQGPAGAEAPGAARQSFFHFYLYRPPGEDVPLNWVLSRQMADYIWDKVMTLGGNAAELAAIRTALKIHVPDGSAKTVPPQSLAQKPAITSFGMDVPSFTPWFDTGIDVQAGEVLNFVSEGRWRDSSQICDADGYKAPYFYAAGFAPRVADDGQYFRLMGHIHKAGVFPGDASSDPATHASFPIGTGGSYRVPQAGRLYVFANDHAGFYWNNSGAIHLTVSLGQAEEARRNPMAVWVCGKEASRTRP